MLIIIQFPISDLRPLANNPPRVREIFTTIPDNSKKIYLKRFGLKEERPLGPHSVLKNEGFYFNSEKLLSLNLFKQKRIFHDVNRKIEFRRFFYDGGEYARLELALKYIKWIHKVDKMNSTKWNDFFIQLLTSKSIIKTQNNRKISTSLMDLGSPLKELFFSSTSIENEGKSYIFDQSPSLVVEIGFDRENFKLLPKKAVAIELGFNPPFKAYYYWIDFEGKKIPVWFILKLKKLNWTEFNTLRDFRVQLMKSYENHQLTTSLLNFYSSPKGYNLNKLKVISFLNDKLQKIYLNEDTIPSAINHYFSQRINSYIMAYQKAQKLVNRVEDQKNSLPKVVVLTAIQEEYLAIKEHLGKINDIDRKDTLYESGVFEFDGKELAQVFIRECGARNTIAAQETERAIQNFEPQMILFVGIAGSRKPQDFSIGDVIFPEKIFSYEGGKSEKDSFKSRPDLAASSFTLFEIAKRERSRKDWKQLIKNENSQKVKADIGTIASGEQIVEHYDSEIGKILTDHFNDTQAVEMEGFGFAKAAMRQGRQTSNMMIGIVRGISDILEREEKSKKKKKKKKKSNEDRRPENSKQIASKSAAAFAFWLVYKFFEKRK